MWKVVPNAVLISAWGVLALGVETLTVASRDKCADTDKGLILASR